MAKVPLTAAGISEKENELFTLPQTELDTQSLELASDFRAWINTNFELTVQEQNFLDSADDDFIRLLSSVVFVSVRNKIPVNFAKSPIVTAVKRFETASNFNFKYTWGGTLSKESRVNLDIIYT